MLIVIIIVIIIIIIVIEAFVLLGCYATYVQRSSSPRRSVVDCLTLEDGTDMLSRNVIRQLSTHAA